MKGITGRFRTAHSRLANGRTKVYYYTKPGGAKFYQCWDVPLQEPFPDDFVEAFVKATRSEMLSEVSGDVASLILAFKESRQYESLSGATKEYYDRDLRLAIDRFGNYSFADIHNGTLRREIAAWHDGIAHRSPRRADLCVSTLSAALGHAFARGEISLNPAIGIKKAWKCPHDKTPWTNEEISRFLENCPDTTKDIFLLAMYTGLRRTDLANITWDAFNGQDIEWKTSKSRQRNTVLVPLATEGISFVSGLKRRWLSKAKFDGTRTMLLSANGRKMTPHTLGKKVNERARKLGIRKTLHRHRNTYATILVQAGFDPHEIAGIMGWSYGEVQQLIRLYVHRDEIIRAQVKKLKSVSKPWLEEF